MKKLFITFGAILFTSVMVQAQNTAASSATTSDKKVEQTTSAGADSGAESNAPVTNTKSATGEESKKAMIEVEKQKADYKKQVEAKVKSNAKVDN